MVYAISDLHGKLQESPQLCIKTAVILLETNPYFDTNAPPFAVRGTN